MNQREFINFGDDSLSEITKTTFSSITSLVIRTIWSTMQESQILYYNCMRYLSACFENSDISFTISHSLYTDCISCTVGSCRRNLKLKFDSYGSLDERERVAGVELEALRYCRFCHWWWTQWNESSPVVGMGSRANVVQLRSDARDDDTSSEFIAAPVSPKQSSGALA